MRCSICGIQIDSVYETVEEGWTPYFYDGEFEHEVACPACTHALLREGADGEWEVKEEMKIGRIIPGLSWLFWTMNRGSSPIRCNRWHWVDAEPNEQNSRL